MDLIRPTHILFRIKMQQTDKETQKKKNKTTGNALNATDSSE